MKLFNLFDGSDAAFEGDLALYWCSLPAGARVSKATIRLSPTKAADGEMFEEIITFTDGQGNLGATKKNGGGFVEVDFHKRRTLAAVNGTNIRNTSTSSSSNGANLQVDVGGLYVEINDKGAIKSPPPDKLFSLPADGSLPGLTVTKFKLTTSSSSTVPDVTQVVVQSVPANVSVRLGQMAPFWTRLGELASDDTSPDFAAALQAFLNDAKIENGVYVIPIVVHSDTVARLKVSLEVDYLSQKSLLPEGLNEVVLPFDFGTVPEAQQNLLQLSLPANARIAQSGTTARVSGTFEETRIMYGPIGDVSPVGTVTISPSSSLAQPILLTGDASATAVDLLMGVTSMARLQVDLRNDLDGKPGSSSLLPNPAQLELPGPVGQVPGQEAIGQTKWVSVRLPAEVQFRKDQRFWLVVQSIEGVATWSVAPAPAGTVGMQNTQDGGLSWRDATASGAPGLLAFLRLRRRPERFQVPIELQVGTGDQAIRVNMDRFQPLGRVDFTLDFDEVPHAFNQYLDKAVPPSCPEIEHLANGDFEQWQRVGDNLTQPASGWSLTSGQVTPFFSEKGFQHMALLGSDSVKTALSQVVPVVKTCPYEISFRGFATQPDALAEVHWMNKECELLRTDQIPIKALELRNFAAESSAEAREPSLLLHRARVVAPASADQAEVRFIVPAGTRASIDQVSLKATAEAVANADFSLHQHGRLSDWIMSPGSAPAFSVLAVDEGIQLQNAGNDTVELLQTQTIKGGQTFVLEFQGRALMQPSAQDNPRAELHWLKADGSPAGSSAILEILPTSFKTTAASGTAPAEATKVEIHLVTAPRTILEVKQISLRFSAPALVPVTFVSQAPGELTVSDWRVAFELAAMAPPFVPDKGLCAPTPPGRQPGEKPKDRCICPSCETEQTMKSTTPVVTGASHPAVVGRCSTCGVELARFAGQRVPGVPPLTLQRASMPRPVIQSPVTTREAAGGKEPLSAEVDTITPLTVIRGIGEARARQLIKSEIDSIKKLADATPRVIAQAIKGVTAETAVGFIEEARRLLASTGRRN